MSLEHSIATWKRLIDEDWDDLVTAVDQVVARATPGRGAPALRRLPTGLLPAVILQPERTRPVIEPLAAVVARAVAEADAELPTDSPLSFALVRMIDLVNALEVIGIAVSGATVDKVRGWLHAIDVTRDQEQVSMYWNVGLAALALGDDATWRRIAGVGDPPARFTPGERFEYNLQGFLAHIGGAVERRASVHDVLPAWHEVLELYGDLEDSRSADENTLLWAGRVIHHRIGGAPVGSVARRLRDDVEALVGG